MAVGDVITAVKTSIEALTPATLPSEVFDVVDYVAMPEGEDIPANRRHRAVVLTVESMQVETDCGTKARHDPFTMRVRLFHDWRRRPTLSAESVRVEDALAIVHCMLFQRPGEADGVEIWRFAGETNPTAFGGNTSVTDLVFEGSVQLDVLGL